MKKSIVIAASVVGILALGYAGASWYVGRIIRQDHTAYIRELDKENGFFKIEEHRFRSKVFSSDEIIAISFPVCQTDGQSPPPLCELAKTPIYLMTWIHYVHGPIPGMKQLGWFTYKTQTSLDIRRNDPDLLWNLAGLPNLTVRGLAKLDGGFTGKLDIPAIHLKIKDPENPANIMEIVTQEITGQFQASQGLATLEGSLSIPLISVSDTVVNNRVEISGISIQGNKRRLSKHLFAGTDDVTVDKILIDIETPTQAESPAQRIPLSLDKLASHYEITESAGLLDFTHKLNGASLSVGGQQFGPFAMDSYFRHVQASAMENYLETMKGFGSPLKPAPSAGQQEEQLKALKAALVELSQTKPSFGFEKLEFKLPGGDANFKLNLAVQGLNPASLDNPAELLGKVELQSALSVTENAVANLMAGFAKTPAEAGQTKQAFPAMVARLIAQGFLRREGDRLAANASLADQKLTVNGKPIPLPSLPQGQTH